MLAALTLEKIAYGLLTLLDSKASFNFESLFLKGVNIFVGYFYLVVFTIPFERDLLCRLVESLWAEYRVRLDAWGSRIFVPVF